MIRNFLWKKGIVTLQEHIMKCGMDVNFLNELIELYNLSCRADKNRTETGVDIFRNFEYGYALRWLKKLVRPESKILDIGSSSTVWPVILLDLLGCEIHATDIDEDMLSIQKHYLYNIGKLDELNNTFFIENLDATSMKYHDGSFDFICAISALEHIPDEGDIQAVSEIERVLKPGGYFIFTAPYSNKFIEQNTEYYHHGYEKRYDFDCIQNRFNSSHKLKRKELIFINGIHDKSDTVSDFWYNYELYRNLGKISMLFSLLMYSTSEDPLTSSKGFIALYQKEGI